MVDDFEILKAKDVIDILIGDVAVGEYEGVQINMPYLTGGNICSLSTSFGYYQKWIYGGKRSRWQYMETAMDFCIHNSKMQTLLNKLFSKEKFQKQLIEIAHNKFSVECQNNPFFSLENSFENFLAKNINKDYNKICEIIINRINQHLIFGDKKLEKANESFRITPITRQIDIEIPSFHKNIIDRDSIIEFREKAKNDIDNGSFDSAITKCRTIIEEVFCLAIEKKGQMPSINGNISNLYNQHRELYHMHTDKNLDKRINKLLSGVSSIISAIAEMRNENSDAHGMGSRRIKVEKHHVVFLLNITSALAGFLLDVADKKLSK